VPLARLPSVALNYVQFPCRRDGDTRDLVLIHGLAASLAFWHAAITMPLSGIGRITSYDLRGHGRSSMPAWGYTAEDMVADFEQLLEHLRLDRVHILAHSFGGTVALMFALRRPERVKSLILADVRLRAIQPRQPLGEWSHWPRWRKVLLKAGIRLNPEDPEGGYELLVQLARHHLDEHARSTHPPLRRLFPSAGHAAAARRWLRLQEVTSARHEILAGDPITQADLARLAIPILALYGELSPALHSGRALAHLNPRVTLEVIPEAGHFFPLTQPEKLVEPVDQFLGALAA
jgi:pimeloyl-ACP methyl ester carboxylesterase